MTQPLPSRVAAEVRAELGRQQLSQRWLAEALGRSQSHVARRLRGAVAFDVAELERLAEVLGVSVTQLLGDGSGPTGPTPTGPGPSGPTQPPKPSRAHAA